MSNCSIDHSLVDVKNKLNDQQTFLPSALYQEIQSFLNDEQHQSKLNEFFHLLKKYDLVSNEEKENRNLDLQRLLTQKNT